MSNRASLAVAVLGTIVLMGLGLLGYNYLRGGRGPSGQAAPSAQEGAAAAPAKSVASGITLRRTEPDPWRVTGAFIVVAHTEAQVKAPGVGRSRAEALQRIQDAHARATAPGASFGEVAKAFSDAPGTAQNQGVLGVLTRRTVRPSYKEIAEPLYLLKVGEISPVFEVPSGYAIVKRLPIEERAVAHVWIQYAGAEGARPSQVRTKDEAMKVAQEALAKARQPGAEFFDIVMEYSEDHPRLKNLGGLMGIFTKSDLAGGPTASLGEAAFKLKPGEVSDIVESPYGLHILSLLDIETYRISGSQILIQYEGCLDADPKIKRTKEEARARAEAALSELRKENASFEGVAREFSDDASAKDGGFIGLITKDRVSQGFGDAIFTLQVGEVSSVIETPEGFYIGWRWE